MGRAVDQRNDFAQVRNRVATTVDCAKTLKPYGAPPVCNGAMIPLRNRANAIFVANTGTAFGETVVRARCGVAGITVQASRIKGGQSLKDALTDEVLDWGSSRSRVFGAGQLCTGAFLPQTLKMVAGVATAGSDPANTTRAPTIVNVTVATPWRAKTAAGTVEGSHATNSSGYCEILSGPVITATSVRWRMRWGHGNHLHGTGCSLNYFLTAE